jgi:hypothetical protein
MARRSDLARAVLSASGRVQPANLIIGEGWDGGKRPAAHHDPKQPFADWLGRKGATSTKGAG